jgi:response regulator RpfG family c-di-GMP phosphodiesterase
MSSKRSYREMLPQDYIIDELEKGKGTQFDPEVAEAMIQLIKEDGEYMMKGV